MKKHFLTFIVLFCVSVSYGINIKDPILIINTDLGQIKIKLYDETPIHRDNFIKLVNEKYYEGVLFHRVIKNFMIQAGDPDSKNAQELVMLGNGGPDYTLPAEINPNLYHKRGAIAAARMADNVNPNKESSGSQFYIVQGNVFTNEQVNQIDDKLRFQKKQSLFNDYINLPENISDKNKIDSLRKEKNQYELNVFIREIGSKLDSKYKEIDNEFIISEEQRKTYTTIGGAPHLDGAYTVFGEVIMGMEIVDQIADVEKDKNDRPLKNIKIISIIISK